MPTVEDEFRDRSVVPGRTLIFHPSDAIAFVFRCQERQVRILGVDAFHIDNDTIQPDMGESIDLSRLPNSGRDSWRKAEDFLNKRLDSGLFFEVVADE